MRGILYFIAIIAAQLLAGGVALLIPRLTGENAVSPVWMGRTLLLVNLLLLTGIILCRRLRPSTQRAPFFRPRSEWRGGSGLRSLTARQGFAAVASVLWAFGLSLALTPLKLDDGGISLLFADMRHDPLCLIELCLIGPLCEEVVFRYGILRSLLRSGRLPGYMAALLSALAFAVIHGNLGQGIPALIIGTVFGLMYLRTGDLRLCLVGHVANNTFAAVLLFFPHLMDFTDRWPSTAVLALAVLHLGLAVLNTRRALR